MNANPPPDEAPILYAAGYTAKNSQSFSEIANVETMEIRLDFREH